jgi:hypothetical protein
MYRKLFFLSIILVLTLFCEGCNKNTISNEQINKSNETKQETTSQIQKQTSEVENNNGEPLKVKDGVVKIDTIPIPSSVPTKKQPSMKTTKCRLYFFNMSELKHYYIDKELPIEDGALVSALTKELQSTAYNKNFLSLTDKVKIKSANLDKTSGILKITFSESYVDKMTLGTNTESGLLTSLLATYGYNLGVKKIAIYFNDKLYTCLGELPKGYFTVDYPKAEQFDPK